MNPSGTRSAIRRRRIRRKTMRGCDLEFVILNTGHIALE